ncbi:hypothetical protein LOD99_7003 [Oopsacas minuta]|uniref:Uncharacterized protein n=1 Tax=Oopsacas minuta TaxID=111878 RepID=A0AAV7JJ50_9METZ|nr:hypothetical protein LOD99_7003 [Oopsacas minuta]
MAACQSSSTDKSLFFTEQEISVLAQYAQNETIDPEIRKNLFRIPQIYLNLQEAFNVLQEENEILLVETQDTFSKFKQRIYSDRAKILELEAEIRSLREGIEVKNTRQEIHAKPPYSNSPKSQSFDESRKMKGERIYRDRLVVTDFMAQID